MRKLLLSIAALALILVASFQVHAWMNVGMVGGGVPAVAGGCTGSLLLSAHFENSDDITAGTPAGCSAGADTTFARTGATYTTNNPQDGTYSLLLDDDTENAIITVTSRDIFDERTGRIDFYFYADNVASSGDIFLARYGDDDYIAVNRSGTEIRLRYNSTTGGAVSVTTSGLSLTNGTSYHIVAQWQSTGDPNLYLTVNAVTASSNTNLTAMAGSPTTLYFGDSGGWAFRGKIDNVKIYNTYSD